MGYTRNKRRSNNFRKSRQLQKNKKATRRQYKGGARQTKRRGQKGGIGGIGSEIKAGFMDQAKKNVAMKLTIEQAGKTLTPEELQIIDDMFPEDKSGKVGVEENYLNTKEKETKTFRDDVLGGKRSGYFGFKGQDTRRVTKVATAAAEAEEAKEEAVEAAWEAVKSSSRDAVKNPTPEQRQAEIKKLTKAKKTQEEAEKVLNSNKNTQILSDKVFEIFKNGGSISFETIARLTKGETADKAKEVDLKEPKCTLTVDNEGKITFSYSVTDYIRPDKNYDFVKSVDNVKYDANSITLRVQRDSKIPNQQPVKRDLVITYGDDTEFVFKSTAAAAAAAAAAKLASSTASLLTEVAAARTKAADAAADDAAAAAVAGDNKILLNKVLSVYLNNLDYLDSNTNTAFSADTIKKTEVPP